MHELVTLQLTTESRESGVYKLFVSTGKQKADFIRELGPTVNKLKKAGYSEESIASFCSALFDGLNRQIYNTPFELYIHSYVYKQFPELRPHEFLSLVSMNAEALRSVTDKKITESTPSHVLWKSKVYNITIALKLRDLYGVDTLKDYKAKTSEQKLAEEMYRDHIEVMQHHEPGDEFRLVEKWAKELGLQNNFQLVDEPEYRDAAKLRVDAASALEQSTVNQPKKRSEAAEFEQSRINTGTNMAVVMYMVAALQYFKDIPADRLKMIAAQIALMGAHGIDPTKEGYKVDMIPDREFTGHELLAYFYVSWALSDPEMLPQLRLPYDEEFELAKQILQKG